MANTIHRMNQAEQYKHENKTNTEIEKIACDFAFMYEGIYPTIITTIVVCILYGYQNLDNVSDFVTNPSDEDVWIVYVVCAILALTLVLNVLVAITKKIFETKRPCQTMGIKTTQCCPDNYDVPSGHTALGIFQGLVLYSTGYHYLSVFFFIQPILRYVGKQHSLSALAVGGMYGIVFFLIFTSLFKQRND